MEAVVSPGFSPLSVLLPTFRTDEKSAPGGRDGRHRKQGPRPCFGCQKKWGRKKYVSKGTVFGSGGKVASLRPFLFPKKKRRGRAPALLLPQCLAQMLHGPPLDAGHLYLADAQHLRGPVLREILIKPQEDDLPFPLGQSVDGGA